MKMYEVIFRKRGLPNADDYNMTVKAENFAGAKYLAGQELGEDYVVTSVRRINGDTDNQDQT